MGKIDAFALTLSERHGTSSKSVFMKIQAPPVAFLLVLHGQSVMLQAQNAIEIRLTMASLVKGFSAQQVVDRVAAAQALINKVQRCVPDEPCGQVGLVVQFDSRDYRRFHDGPNITDWSRLFGRLGGRVALNGWVVGNFETDLSCPKSSAADILITKGCADRGGGWFAISADADPPHWAHEILHAAGLPHRPDGPKCVPDPCNIMSCVVSTSNHGLINSECRILSGSAAIFARKANERPRVLVVGRSGDLANTSFRSLGFASVQDQTTFGNLLDRGGNELSRQFVAVVISSLGANLASGDVLALAHYVKTGGQLAVLAGALPGLPVGDETEALLGATGPQIQPASQSGDEISGFKKDLLAKPARGMKLTKDWFRFQRYDRYFTGKYSVRLRHSSSGEPVLWTRVVKSFDAGGSEVEGRVLVSAKADSTNPLDVGLMDCIAAWVLGIIN